MQRFILALVVSLLLVGTQHEARRHALEHLRPLLTRTQDVGFHAPAAEVMCAECALSAAGADAIASAVGAHSGSAPTRERPTFAHASRAVAAPSYFQSRAPPVFL